MSGRQDEGSIDRTDRLAGEVLNRLASCPPADRLQEFHAGDLPATERASVAAHIPECDACRAALEFLTGATSGEEAGPGLAGAVAAASDGLLDALAREADAPAPSGRGWLYGLAAAAVVALAFVLVPLLPPPPPAGSPAFRQPEEAAIQSLLPEDVPLPRNSFRLRWTPGPEGSRYDVLVLRGDLTVLDRASGRQEPGYDVPPETFQGVPSGTQILWQVELLLPDGKRERSLTFLATLE